MTNSFERANAIRVLAMDAVERAKSGHPGAPMGLADVAEVLWREFLIFNPHNPDWFNRDRFVLSNGHSSMLLYAVLHLTGYEITIEDLKQFRQLHSKTAGHPEYGECPGIETTTGPLGQGFANAVGMAIAEKHLAQEFNRTNFPVVDHRTWVIVGDGCMMEGISHEAASLANTLNLGKLIVLYDDNGISIDGETKGWFTEDVPARFRAYGWRTLPSVDGHDNEAVRQALTTAVEAGNQPTFVPIKTTIGFGAPTLQGTAKTHGSPLGISEVAMVREKLNWNDDPFQIPNAIYSDWDMRSIGIEREASWQSLFSRYQEQYPELANELMRRIAGLLPDGSNEFMTNYLDEVVADTKAIATRKASGMFLNSIAPRIPELIGGSADLSDSNNTEWKSAGRVKDGGRYLHYGVREFAMSAIANGIALHKGLIPYSGTFLIFMEYARNAVRLASLMGIRQIFVYTHDSVGLGEDGPTHQPIEQLTNLRTTPNLSVWRPCDGTETTIAWRAALERTEGPTAIVLTRQSTQSQARTKEQIEQIHRGGYVLRSESTRLDLILIATGSEVALAMGVAAQLEDENIGVRVVSLPSVDWFLAQPADYQNTVLPNSIRARVVVEASHPDYWYKFVGHDGAIVGINRYGVSAPGDVAMDHLGINFETVYRMAKEVLN